jgi:hypothetical protein
VQKKAAERLRAFEHPALDVFQRVLEADEAHPEHRALAIRVAESVLDRTGHKQPKKLEIDSRQTLDPQVLSTGLLRQDCRRIATGGSAQPRGVDARTAGR